MQDEYNKLAANYQQIEVECNGLLAFVEQENTKDKMLIQKEKVIKYFQPSRWTYGRE